MLWRYQDARGVTLHGWVDDFCSGCGQIGCGWH
jgi:hypothetical protein